MLPQILFAPDAVAMPPPRTPPNPFVSGERSLVAVVRGMDVPATVRRAIDLPGGPERLDLAVPCALSSGPTACRRRSAALVAGFRRRVGLPG